jgi:hypothetical protein
VTNLKMSWLKLTGKLPPRAANRDEPGPFARLVKECLSLAGAKHVDAINLINSIE